MDLPPLRAAALGMAGVAAATLAVSQSRTLADWISRRAGLSPGLGARCRTHTLVLICGAIALACLAEVLS